MENEIVLREEELEDICTSLSGDYIDVSSTGECINYNFSGAVNAGLLGDSVGIISNQMSAISESIGKVHNLINQYSNQMISFDNEMASKIDEIEIPHEFLANNSSKVNKYVQYLVGKIDGQSVNNGQEAYEFKEIDESSVKEKDLKDIHGNKTAEQTFDDTISIADQEVLTDITGTEAQTFNEIDDSTINEIKINKINGKETTEQYYDDTSLINNQKDLSNINNGITQEFNEIPSSTYIEDKDISDLSINKTNDFIGFYDNYSDQDPFVFAPFDDLNNIYDFDNDANNK